MFDIFSVAATFNNQRSDSRYAIMLVIFDDENRKFEFSSSLVILPIKPKANNISF